MAMTGRTTAVAVFDRLEDARQAAEDLRRDGFEEAEIGVSVPEAQSIGEGVANEEEIDVLAKLRSLDVPEEEARFCDEQFRAGCAVLTVRTFGRYEDAVRVLRRHGGSTDNKNRPTRDDYTVLERTPGLSTGSGHYRGEYEALPGKGTGTGSYRSWNEVKGQYEREWEEKYGGSAERRWKYDEPGYRCGYAAAHDRRYRGRAWEEVEPQLRSEYEEWAHRAGYHEEEHGWDRAVEGIRHVWDRLTKSGGEESR